MTIFSGPLEVRAVDDAGADAGDVSGAGNSNRGTILDCDPEGVGTPDAATGVGAGVGANFGDCCAFLNEMASFVSGSMIWSAELFGLLLPRAPDAAVGVVATGMAIEIAFGGTIVAGMMPAGVCVAMG